MKRFISMLLVLPAALLFALPVPKAAENPAVNLSGYLTYRAEGKLALSCRNEGGGFTCEAARQTVEALDGNDSTVITFKTAFVHFNGAVAALLEKEPFAATMKELEELERLRQQYLAAKKPYIAPPSTPKKDTLERGLIGSLEGVNITGFNLHRQDPPADLHIEQLHFFNGMKRTAKGAAFAERIFGRMRLEYSGATLESNTTHSSYGMLPSLLESWFETNDTARADYVGNKLAVLEAKQPNTPFSGTVSLQTSYEGNDTLGAYLHFQNANKLGTRDILDLQVEIHTLSALFTPALHRKELPGIPDLLFKTMHALSTADGSAYRTLLKTDKRFAAYIGQYDLLLRGSFDAKLKTYAYSPELTRWFAQAKKALSALLTGRADTLEIDVRNRSGHTAMDVFSLFMDRLMAEPPSANQTYGSESVIADTAVQHLEVKIEAR